MILSFGDFADDAGVRGQVRCCVFKHVVGRGHELFLVVLASVTDDDLGGVFVRHDDCRARKSTAVRVGVIRFKRLPCHTSVKV